MAHLEAEWPSKQNILIFYFFLLIIFYFHLPTQFRQNRGQKIFYWVPSCLCRGDRLSGNLYLIHNTALAHCANYKINRYSLASTNYYRFLVCNQERNQLFISGGQFSCNFIR